MVRVLVVGPVGSLEECVPKLTKIIARSGPFEMCLLLRPPSGLPQKWVQVPTYFVADSFGDENKPRLIAPHIKYKGSCFSEFAHGLRVVMCPNDEAATAIVDRLEREAEDFAGVDVMVTHCGPKHVTGGSEAVSRLGRMARPRYHFFGADLFHSFDPFQGFDADYATRVFSVGQSGRWVYAADVKPLQRMSKEDRRNTLAQRLGTNLYTADQLKKRHLERTDDKKTVQKRVRKDCWFCLSNTVEQHLVVAVGEHVYIALAKGGINDSHLVIVPVAHVVSSTSQQASVEMLSEVEKYMKAIRRYYQEKRNSEAMIFEWCGKAEMMHMCVQTIAIRKEVCGRLANLCVDIAKRFGLELQLEQGLDGLSEARRRGAVDCFWAEFPSGQRVIATFEDKKKLPANFGRVVVAQTLGLLDRIDWRKCAVSRTAEEALAQNVDHEIQPFLSTDVSTLKGTPQDS